jgi:hypothetical protein
LPFRADKQTLRVFPPGRDRGPIRTLDANATQASAWPCGVGMGSAWRCGRGGSPRHGSDAVPPPHRAGTGNAPRFPARARRCPVDRQVREHGRPAPDPAGEKRPPGAGRALAGGFGPRLAWGQPGAVAGAMAPANEAVKVPSHQEPHCFIPACAERFPVDRQVRAQHRPAPDPAGAGKGLWPPAVLWHAHRRTGAMARRECPGRAHAE